VVRMAGVSHVSSSSNLSAHLGTAHSANIPALRTQSLQQAQPLRHSHITRQFTPFPPPQDTLDSLKGEGVSSLDTLNQTIRHQQQREGRLTDATIILHRL